MDLVARAKNMILTPRTEWDVVEKEAATTSELFIGYVLPLSAIGPIFGFIGMVVIGVPVPFLGTFRLSLGSALTSSILAYVLGLVSIVILAWIIDALATTFGGQRNRIQAFKVAAFSYTPVWVAGVLRIVPWLGILILVAACYSLYVLYLGLPPLMKAAREKAVAYTIVVVVCSIVLGVIVSFVAGTVTGTSHLVGGMASRGSGVTFAPGRGSEAIQGLQQMAANLHTAANPQAQGAPAVADTVDPGMLKALVPDAVGGLRRTSLEASKATLGTFTLSKVEATFTDDKASVNLTILDGGGTGIFPMLAAWSFIESDKQTDTGYERITKVGGRSVHEKFSKPDQSGEYSVIVAGRFIVEAQGRQVDMTMVKAVVSSIDLGKLESLKLYGVHS